MHKPPLSACEAAHQLAQRTLRAEDLVRDCLERIDAREPEVHAWTYVARDAALARAKALDQGAHQGLLHGLLHEPVHHLILREIVIHSNGSVAP